MAELVISPARDFKGWDIWEYIKGRKKLAVALIGGAIGYIIQDSASAMAIGASATELIFAVVEYWIKVKYQ